jgi:hypothetical protein
MRWTTRRVVVVATLAIALAGVAVGTSIAAFPTDNVKLYTGCLTTGGTFVNIAEGNTPKSACDSPKQVVKLSGGDITKITAGTGVSVTPAAGDNGEVTVGVAAGYGLPQGCDTFEFPMKTSSNWVCADHALGTGLGLSKSIANGAGEVEYSISSNYRVQNTPDCSSGQFATGFTDAGVIACAAPSALSSFNEPQVGSSQPIDSDGAYHRLVSVTINANSAGTYLLIAKGSLVSSGDADDFHEADCAIRKNATDQDVIRILSDTLQDVRNSPFSLTAVVTVASGDELAFSCLADAEADGVSIQNGRFVGVKIGS